MQMQDGFRRFGYRTAAVLLLTATFVALFGVLWAAVILVALAIALVAAVEEINDAAARRGDGRLAIALVSGFGRAG